MKPVRARMMKLILVFWLARMSCLFMASFSSLGWSVSSDQAMEKGCEQMWLMDGM